MTTWDQLAERIEASDAAGVVGLCAGLPEAARRAVAVEAVAAYRADPRNRVAGLVVLATGARSDVNQLWPLVTSEQPEACVAILADRQPAWLGGWLTARLEQEPQWAAFEVAWQLRLRGLYAAEGPGYVMAFVAAVGNSVLHPRTPIYDLLRAHRSLLDDELWRAFQVEGGGQTSFAAHDKYMPEARSWSVALRRLSNESLIDRARLIDATLEALARGFSAFRAGWFVRFHDTLELTDDERKTRGERYLDLLGSPTPQVQSFAVRAVATLDQLAPVPAPRLIRALRQAVLNAARASAAQALRLIETAARRDPSTGMFAARAAAEALVHEAPDVQAQAMSILERCWQPGDAELERALASAAPVLAPSLRSRLGALTSAAAVPTRGAQSVDGVPATAWPESILEAEVLSFREPIRPVESTAELALVVARALEHPEEIDTVEQALGGISRMCIESRAEPASFWSPLRKRAGKLYRVGRCFRGQGLLIDFPAVVLAWLNREPPAPLGDDVPKTALGFLSARLHAIAITAGSSTARPLLSAPTHAGGWIDPEVLVARLAAAGHEPADRADLVLALLRLAPERRAEALAAAAAVGTTEAGDALRFALGSDRERPGAAPAVWVAAVRARHPGSDALNIEDAALANLGAGALSIARPTLSITRRPSKDSNVVWHDLRVGVTPAGPPASALFPTVSMHTSTRGTGAFAEADVRWCATLHPSDLEPLFTEGVAHIGNNLDWWEAHWAERAYLEPLLELRTSFSTMAVCLVTLAMAAKEPGIRGLAAEITARALADGRLPVETLGRSLGEWWASPLVTPRRFGIALASAAATSPATGGLVRQAMGRALRSAPHADAAPILELFYELSCAAGVGLSDPIARAILAEYRGGKAGRLASSVLAL